MEELRFKYSAFLQNVDIVIYEETVGGNRRVVADAAIKVPILKKHYQTYTEYNGQSEEWAFSVAPFEEGVTPKVTKRGPQHGEALDPLTFFLKLHSGEWKDSSVKLAMGSKVIELGVEISPDGYEVRHPSKDQKLVVRRDKNGIKTLELPVPVLGSLKLQRT